MDMFTGIPRGVTKRGGRQLTLEEQAMPMAAFMTEDAIRASRLLLHDGRKVLLGAIAGRIEMRDTGGRSEAHVLGGQLAGIGDDRHAVMIAGSRAGKGRSGIIPTLLTYEGSVLAIDPKGELATVTARQRHERLGQRVAVLDPFGVVKGYATRFRARFNPLTMLKTHSPTMIEDAGLTADAIVVQEAGNKDPHWDSSARNLIEGVNGHVATAPNYAGRRNLSTMRDLIAGNKEATAGKGLKRVRAEMEENDAAGGFVQDAAADFFEKPEEERGSVLSTARRHLRFLSYPAIRESVSGHDFDLADLKRERMTVYLCLPAMRMATCNRWLRLFINQALETFEREPVKPDPPVLLVLDEFATLGHMGAIEGAAGFIAGYGVKLWVILQDLGQLKSLYRERWETFMGNAGVVQVFGLNDATSLEYVAKRLGTTSLIVRNKAEVGDQDQTRTDRRGLSWSVQTQGVMTLEEVGRFFGRDDPLQRQLVLWAGYDPMILQRVKYDSREEFKGCFDAPA
jgi:type IV secretion system protein VirD4